MKERNKKSVVLGSLLRKYREDNKKRGNGIVRLVDLSCVLCKIPSALSNYENGSSNMDMDLFLKWCDALDRKPQYVFNAFCEKIYGARKR